MDFCDSPADIEFYGDEVKFIPKWRKEWEVKNLSRKDVIDCKWGCDAMMTAAMVICNRFHTKAAQIACGVSVVTFTRKCYECCEIGMLANCIDPYISWLPAGMDIGIKPSNDFW